MQVRSELIDLLARLPALDGPAERKTLVAFTGPPDVGIYLNWQGSAFDFAQCLVEEVSVRGKAALSGFLAALPTTPQLKASLEWQQKTAALRAQVDALDAAAFVEAFPATQPAGAPAARPPADPAMLAGTVVGDVLAPFYELGKDRLRQKSGESAAQAAGQIAALLEARTAGDDAAADILATFRDQPQANAALLTRTLKRMLSAEPALVAQVADLYATATARPEQAGLQSLLDVSQEVGVVRGTMVGAIVGSDVLSQVNARVAQHIQTVEDGGVVIGAFAGQGTPIIGGRHQFIRDVDTGGGAFFAGNAQAGRDITGRDQIVVDDSPGAGVAAGPGAQAAGSQGLSAAEVAALFQPILARIDARPPDPGVEKQEIRNTVEQVQAEVAKGDQANENRLERLLKTLALMAPDILDVTAATLTNPLAGIGTVIRKVVARARAGTA